MPITSTSPWNKTYVHLEGDFTGTLDTHFQVVITTNNGNVFKHRKKVGTGSWGAYTENVSIPSAGASVVLSDGMSAKFTRPALGSYTQGDSWKFLVVPDLLLDISNTTSNAYSNIATIEDGNSTNLIALSDSTGSISVVKDFESENPEVESGYVTNLSPNSDGYSLVKKNKEIYVAAGKSNNPMWVGYNKLNGFEGTTDNYNFISETAYQQLDSTASLETVFSDFVVLKAGGTSMLAPKIYAGIKEDDSNLYIVNQIDNKSYKFSLSGKGRRIRENPAQFDSNNNCNGVAVLCDPQTSGADSALDFWEIPITGSLIGQNTNKTKTVHLFKPEQNESSYGIHDFLIVASKASAHTSGTTFTLWVSIPGVTEAECSQPIFKYLNINSQTTDITASSWINMKPDISDAGSIAISGSTPLATSENKFVRYEKELQSSGFIYTIDGTTQNFKTIQKINLGLMGYDDTGQLPFIGFTTELRRIRRIDYGQAYGSATLDGAYCDGNRLWILRWVTFLIGNGSSGSTKCKMLAHFSDYGGDTGSRWDSYTQNDDSYLTDMVEAPYYLNSSNLPDYSFLAGSTNASPNEGWLTTQVPHTTPMYARGAGIDDGSKYGTIGWGSYGNRHGTYYIRVSASNPKIHMFKTVNQTGVSPWDNDLNVFPNTYATLYTNFTAASTKTSEIKPDVTSHNLPHDSSSSGDSARYRLGDRPYLAQTDATTKVVVATEGFFASQPLEERANVGTTERLVKVALNTTVTSDATNLLGTASAWLEINNAGFNTSKDWIGETSKKNFYKVSILYDGFQESTLLEATLPKNNGTSDIVKAVTGDLVIKDRSQVSNRVTAFVLYRAIDSAHDATSPENLYRFVEEIPLYKFSVDTNDHWKYQFEDEGNNDASYEAINGISEELSNLNIKYGVNADANGYMFVGDCSHSQFEDAENIIFRSQAGKYSIFDWSKDYLQMNFKPIAMKGFLGKLYVWGVDKMAIVNPQTLVIEDEIVGIGCSNKKSVKVTPTGLYWCDLSNIYNSTPNISKIGTTIQKQESYGWSNLDDSVKQKAVLGYDTIRQCVLVFFSKETEHRCWAYSAGTKRWDLWDTSHEVYDAIESKSGHAVLLLANGRICKYSSGSNNKSWEWQSKKIGFGEDTIVKKVRLAKLDATARNHTAIQYKSNLEDDDWHAGTNISNNYGTTWQGNAIKVDSSYSKLRWFKVKATGTNNGTGSNHKGNSIGIIYKRKKPK